MSYRGPTPNWRQMAPKTVHDVIQQTNSSGPSRKRGKQTNSTNQHTNSGHSAKESGHQSNTRGKPTEKEALPLHDAARKGNTEKLEKLLKKDAGLSHDVDEEGYTALHIAAIHGYAKCASILCQNIDTETRSSAGRTPLHEASANGRSNVIKLLVGFYADINAQDKTNLTPLMLSVKGGHTDIARLLIDNGADTTMVGHGYNTALSLAIRAKNIEMTECLIKRTPQIRKFVRGHQYLHVAISNFVPEIVEMLLPLVGDVNEKDKEFDTPLHVAVRSKIVEAVKMLLEKGANPNLWNKNADNPLHIAAEEDATECIKVLLKADCDINKKNHQGDTPTHVAVTTRSVGALKALVAGRAYLTKRNQQGRSPVDLAVTNGFQEGCQILNEALGIRIKNTPTVTVKNDNSCSESDSSHSKLTQEKVAALTKQYIRSDDADPVKILKEACQDPMEKTKILNNQSEDVIHHTKQIHENLIKIASRYLVGNKVKLLLSRPDGNQEAELTVIGRALCTMLYSSGALPSEFATSTVILLLSPDLEIPPETILDDFLQFVSSKQRKLLLKSTFLTLSEDELEDLAKIYALYGGIHVPQTDKTLREAFLTTLQDLAFSVVCAQQKKVTNVIKKGISETDRKNCWKFWLSYFEDGNYKSLGNAARAVN